MSSTWLFDALRGRKYPLNLLLVSIVILVGPWLYLNGYWVRQLLLVAITVLLASSLNLSFGYAGEFAIGQVAIFAGSCYLVGYVSTNVINDLLISIVLAVCGGLVFGLLTGLIGLRLGGWSLAMVSGLMVVLIPEVVQMFGTTLGGSDGLYGIPEAEIFGYVLTNNGLYLAGAVLVIGWFVLFRNLVVSSNGRSMLVSKESPILVASLGISSWRLKMTAYAISSVPVALAGVIFVYLNGYVGPSSFTLSLTIEVIAVAILGGMTSVYGVLAGGAIIQLFTAESGSISNYQVVAYGILLVVGGALLSGGIARLLRVLWSRAARMWERHRGQLPDSSATASLQAHRAGPTTVALGPFAGEPLRVTSATHTFGGNRAVDDVSFEALPGAVTGLIGPNGSGKTTMLNLICGFHHLDDGEIALGDTELNGLPPYRVARHRVTRTFQTPIMPDGLTVKETVASGSWGQEPATWWSTALRLPWYWRKERAASAQAERCMSALGIDVHSDAEASKLPLGTRRLVELARAVAGQPSLLLLDEVASGLDEEEVDQIGRVISDIRSAGCTVVLVEHNFELIRRVSDVVVVLAEGRVIARGSAAEVEALEEVRMHYLGPTAARSRDQEVRDVAAEVVLPDRGSSGR
jgi:branched-chain amino acid transport system permease protein